MTTTHLPEGDRSGTSPSRPAPTPLVQHRAPRRPGGRTPWLWRGDPEDPRWARPALLGLLAVTAALFLWGLGASGWANNFYSAAAQAGGASWKAFLFGSSDAGNAITVDKPPATLWPMALSVRLFGLGAWQILVPQALMGVASVGVLHAAVKRRSGAGAGLLAGGVLALTPVAALMFRFNNPDALLALLMVVALYCTQRALEDARTKWLILAGACFGFAFLTKTLQAWLILPVVAVVHLVCGPTRLRRRIGQLLLGGLTMVVCAGWWVALAELWPADSRPYIGGSQTNSFLELTLGYNGFGRITGDETGSLGGTGNSSDAGVLRMFSTEMGGQIAWLLPAALLLLVAGLVVTRRAARTDAVRSGLLLWGGSLVMTCAFFSFLAGIFHAYYTVALAPYIAALVGMGGALLWQRRSRQAAAVALALVVAATAVWSYVLLGRAGDWLPWLRWTVLVVGLAAAAGVALVRMLSRRLAATAAGSAVLVSLAGPAAYTLDTVSTTHSGALVTAGPSTGMGGPGGGGPGGGGPGGGGPGGGKGGGAQQKQRSQQAGPGRQGGQKQQGGGTGGQAGQPGKGAQPGKTGKGGPGGGGGMGNVGAMLNGATVSSAAKGTLSRNADAYTWAAATIGSSSAASYQLAAGAPVMAVGGYNGTDPSPTIAQFKKYVEDARIHYYVSGGAASSGTASSGTASAIDSWVKAHFTKSTAGSSTLYDLTQPKSST